MGSSLTYIRAFFFSIESASPQNHAFFPVNSITPIFIFPFAKKSLFKNS
jgi:hypothetical protein